LLALLGAVGGLDQTVGYAAHGGDYYDHGLVRGCGLDDGGCASDAIGVAYGGAAEFHYLQGAFHFVLASI